MSTINELLVEHNALAGKLSAMKLKVWKSSKKGLEDRIEGFKRQINEDVPKGGKLAEALTKKIIKDKIDKDNTLSIVEVAEELGISAKVARAKLRRKGMKANEGRWPTFKRDSVEHKDFINLLKGTNNGQN